MTTQPADEKVMEAEEHERGVSAAMSSLLDGSSTATAVGAYLAAAYTFKERAEEAEALIERQAGGFSKAMAAEREHMREVAETADMFEDMSDEEIEERGLLEEQSRRMNST